MWWLRGYSEEELFGRTNIRSKEYSIESKNWLESVLKQPRDNFYSGKYSSTEYFLSRSGIWVNEMISNVNGSSLIVLTCDLILQVCLTL